MYVTQKDQGRYPSLKSEPKKSAAATAMMMKKMRRTLMKTNLQILLQH
jgi:hypothetical protein